MFAALARLFAGLSLALKQPLRPTATWRPLTATRWSPKTGITSPGCASTACSAWPSARTSIAITEAMRLDLSGALETRGHAIVGWYISDPDAALVEIERLNLASCRNIAREVGLDLHDILDERAKLWPKLMRWEAAYLILWTRTVGADQGGAQAAQGGICGQPAKELGAVGQTAALVSAQRGDGGAA